MQLDTFHELLTPRGQAALQAATALAPRDATILQALTRLRRDYPDELAQAAIETVLLRQRGANKFSRAAQMYFVREALEQSTSEAVATYRAQRFRDYPLVGDFACGIGGDAIALSAVTNVVAVDVDPLRLAMANENVAAYERADRVRFRCQDLCDDLPEVNAAFVDPARRTGDQRTLNLEAYQPSFSTILNWRERIPALAVKIAPGIAQEAIANLDAECEFISLRAELKECITWFGDFRTAARRATLLPSAATLTGTGTDWLPDFDEPRGYLYDPDPAVTRAGLLPTLAEQLDAWPLDAAERYLCAADAILTPFAACIAIEAALPYHSKHVRAWLREHRVGRVEIRQRAVHLDGNRLMREWKLDGPEFRIVVMASVRGAIWAIIGQLQRSPE